MLHKRALGDDGLLFAAGIYQALRTAFEFEAEISFRAFLQRNTAAKWIIAADFVTSGPERVNDTFAFTVYPYQKDNFDDFLSENRAAMPADIKHVKALHPHAAAFLADRSRFHFCFIPDRGRHELGTWEDTQQTLSEVIEYVTSWSESPQKPYYLRKFESLRQRAKKTKFNYKLLHDITLLAALASYLALLIAKHSRSEIIMFAFDRDPMTTGFDSILYDLAHLNFDSACQLEGVNKSRVTLSNTIDIDAAAGRPAWFDDLIRPPDYIAGAMARWEFRSSEGLPVRQKVADVIEAAISENPNLVVFYISCNVFGLTCLRMKAFNRENPNRTAYDNTIDDIVDYLVWAILRKGRQNQRSYRRAILDASCINGLSLISGRLTSRW